MADEDSRALIIGDASALPSSNQGHLRSESKSQCCSGDCSQPVTLCEGANAMKRKQWAELVRAREHHWPAIAYTLRARGFIVVASSAGCELVAE
ncbi:hypothetical protein E2562_023803 [Oryza meyeriana var. granulata]|uniref:Uncharacterized protein n=1 Tax=Oryza meyeriana var. granulata TaxID=110450 RepID=A0A6G1C7G9_9ORYZ|nr:hypothetical protein E2562_023803 [Oryza meyeriana var. granulata]